MEWIDIHLEDPKMSATVPKLASRKTDNAVISRPREEVVESYMYAGAELSRSTILLKAVPTMINPSNDAHCHGNANDTLNGGYLIPIQKDAKPSANKPEKGNFVPKTQITTPVSKVAAPKEKFTRKAKTTTRENSSQTYTTISKDSFVFERDSLKKKPREYTKLRNNCIRSTPSFEGNTYRRLGD